MGRARQPMQAVAAQDPFHNLLGGRRGTSVPLDQDRDPLNQFRELVDEEGVSAGYRKLMSFPSQILETQLAGCLTYLNQEIFRETYQENRSQISDFLRAVGTRPHWMLYFFAADNELHYFPEGNFYADSDDLNTGQPTPICGKKLDHYFLLNRGSYASLGRNPASFIMCSSCAQYPEVVAHYETQDSDLINPVPQADEKLLTEWFPAIENQLAQAVLHQASEPDLEAIAIKHLGDTAVRWAAEVLSAHPRPNIIRALRSNGAGYDASINQLEQIVAKLRLLSADQWTALLEEFRSAGHGKMRASREWARILIRESGFQGFASK